MEQFFNLPALFVAALVNMAVGFVWYNPKVFGNAWMKETGMTDEKIKSSKMGIIFGVSFLFALMLSFTLIPMVTHQAALFSICDHQLHGTDIVAKQMAEADIAGFLAKYGNDFRDFKHGALHGFLLSIFFVLPVLGTNALFERKSWKYIFINVGFWALSLTLMGGILCAWH